MFVSKGLWVFSTSLVEPSDNNSRLVFPQVYRPVTKNLAIKQEGRNKIYSWFYLFKFQRLLGINATQQQVLESMYNVHINK